MDIHKVLDERGKNYGEFKNHAYIAQKLKDVMFDTANWGKLASDQKECLEMVAHKIARILNGDVNYLDSWVDQIGYLQLVIDRMMADKQIYPPVPECPSELPSFLKLKDASAA